MWARILDHAMRRFIRTGAVQVTFPDGMVRRYGDDGPPVRVAIRDPALLRRLVVTPDLAMGEGYMDGTITIAGDDLRGLLRTLVANRGAGHEPRLLRAWQWVALPLQRWIAHNRIARARANVAHHYDLSGALYDLFLDADRQYSCAYFTDPGMGLEAAQEAKKHHVARKLCLRPGHHVLDIGCGWGGMAITLARDYGVHVTGVTLSREQHRVATERVAAAGLSDRVTIRVQDYRQVRGPFDRIVSVGMFEHVGAPHFRAYFTQLRALLAPDGVALVHTIGTATPPRATGQWVRRHIFPGGYLPAMSEVVGAIEKARLTVADIEVLRLHYAYTLQHWAARFEACIDDARALYDDRFCRMWRFYLCAAEQSFRGDALNVFQFQLVRDKAAVPLTRDYLYAAEGAAPARLVAQ